MASSSLQLVPPQTVWHATRNRTREELWHAEGCKCHWCGKPTRLCANPEPDQATIEHIVPRAKGGTDARDNLVSACHLCNARRAYEQAMGVPDGSMLATFPVTDRQKRAFGLAVPVRPQGKPNYCRHIALTGDEKKAIIAGNVAPPSSPVLKRSVAKHQTEDVLREQRDQALRELTLVRNELKLFHKIVDDQEKDLKTMTVWKLIRKRISEWIRP